MSLAPVPHALGVFGPPEVIAVGRLAQPSALAGQFAGLSTSRFAAVMLVVFVAVIGEEKITATAAFTSLGPQGHGGPNDHDPEIKKSPTPEAKKDQGTKKEEELSAEVRKKIHREENTISNRRRYCIFIPPLTLYPYY